MDDLEQTPVEVIADYVNSLELKPDGKKRFISVLNSFWNYYTVVSFSGDRKAPYFYRNVMNEWINEYGRRHVSINNLVMIDSEIPSSLFSVRGSRRFF